MLEGVETIIFDLGGVLLNISPETTIKEFAKLGAHCTAETFQPLRGATPFSLFETGKITEQTFYNEVREYLHISSSDEEIKRAWNSMILDFPVAHVELLRSLKESYELLLLSNTNAMHYDCYSSSFSKTYGISFSSLFHSEYLSHEIGERKPGRAIFTKLLEEGGVRPEKSLFIDDSLPNIVTSKEFGISSIHLKPSDSVTNLFVAS